MILSLRTKNIIQVTDSTTSPVLTYNELCPYKYKAVIICIHTAETATPAQELALTDAAAAAIIILPDAQGR